MALSLRSRFWRGVLRKFFKPQALSIAKNRLRGDKNAKLLGWILKRAQVEHVNIDGIRAESLSFLDTDQEKVILYLHGGGYVTGSALTHRMMCALLAKSTGAKVLVPDYRLAPEHPFPAALDDSLKVFHWLLAQGYQPANIIIAGDSAGGGLSVAVTLALRDTNDPLPAAVVSLSPWADLTLKGQSHITKAKSEAVLRTEVLREWALCYTEEANLRNPLVSPVYADFHGFPPLLIQVGSEEILLDDAILLTEKAKRDGAEVELKIWDGMWHVWQALGILIPESKKTFEEMANFLRGADDKALAEKGFGKLGRM